MNKILKYVVFVISAVAILSSCKDNNEPNYGNGGAAGTKDPLKASSPVTIGMETDYAALGSAGYLETAAANASQTTFGYAMTHGAVVKDDGTFDFTMPDKQLAAVKAGGIQDIWGKTLCWYQSQNANYMNEMVGGTVVMPNLVTNGDCEDWSDASTAPEGWSFMNGADYFSQGTGVNAIGNYSVAIGGYGGTLGSGQWHVQLGATFPTVVGHIYNVTFDAKGSSSDCYYQGEWDNGQGTVQYTGDKALSTSWTNYTFSFGKPMAASQATTTITFDMAQNPVGSTVYIDNLVVTDQTAADSIANAISSPEHKIEVADAEFRKWVTAMVTHYKGLIGWDVVSELFADDGTIRTNANTSSSSATDWFVWSNYLGKEIGITAFNLAHAADPKALLFINESDLESNTAKLDALIDYVQWLQSKGVHIDGISTEMHVNIATAMDGVDYMFQKLAATQLKIRISELDVKVNNNSIFQFTLTPEVLGFQAVTYHDVIASYLKYVPKDQQQDITIWGVNDSNSWLYNDGADYPLLFDDSYLTKPAFDGVLQALKGQ